VPVFNATRDFKKVLIDVYCAQRLDLQLLNQDLINVFAVNVEKWAKQFG
jgi:hypothetical protein